MNRSPLSQMSAKRRKQLAELGIHYPSSTFAPKTPAGGGPVPTSARGSSKTAATKSQSRPQPAVPDDVREALKERSGGWCEAQIPGVCSGRAIDPHHRIKQQSGGRHGAAKTEADRLSNVVYLCRPCHRWAHWEPFSVTNPLGLILRQHDNPAQEPVLYRGEPKYLSDDGRVVALEEVGA